MEESIFYVLICANDPVAREIYKTYVTLFSRELSRYVEIYTYCYQDHELQDIVLGNCLFDAAILEIDDIAQEDEVELARSLLEEKKELPIIYISSNASFRVRASELLGIGFLEKPVDQEQFRILYYRATGQALLSNAIGEKQYLELLINKKKVYLKLCNIICLEKIQKKILYVTKNSIYEERNTIVSVMTRLPPYFLQIRQSVVVNMNEIICIEGREVYMTTRRNYIIGRTFQKNVELCYRRFAR